MRLALTGVVVVDPVDVSRAVAASQPASASAPSPATIAPALAMDVRGRAAWAGDPAGVPVTV